MFTSFRKYSATGKPEIVSTPVVRHSPEDKHLVLRVAYIAIVIGVRGMSKDIAEGFLYGKPWDKLTELESNFDKKYSSTDEPLSIAGTRTAFMDRCAKSDNLTESHRETEKWMRRVCLTEHFFISDSVIGRCQRGTLSGDEVFIIIGCRLPVILRQKRVTEAAKTFTLVRMCYAHGILDRDLINNIYS